MVRLALGIALMKLQETNKDAFEAVEAIMASVVVEISEQYSVESAKLFDEEVARGGGGELNLQAMS